MIDFSGVLTNPFRVPPPVMLPLDVADARALARLHASAFPLSNSSWGASEFHSLLSQKGVFGFKASRPGRDAAEPRGFVLVREAAGDAEILTLAVHPSWQGRGLGRLLMEEALRELYARRAVSLFLEVNEDNKAAMRLYARLGFEQIGRRDSYYKGPDGAVAALTMRLDL